MNFKEGDQIVYIPNHAPDMFHQDAEFGFITGFNLEGNPFCRYWRNPDKTELRTRANSECTPIDMIHRCDLKPQKVIDDLMVELDYRKKAQMPEIDHEYTTFPICPKCGCEDIDWWDGLPPKNDGDSWKWECQDCNSKITVTMNVETTFITELKE